MKLLFVVDGLQGSSLDGPALWLSALGAHWAAEGHRVDVVCTRAERPVTKGPEAPPEITVYHPGPDGFDGALGECLSRAPDAVHISSAGPFGPRVVEILHDLPVLLDVHDFWPVCPARDLIRRPRLQPCGEHYPFQGCGPCAGIPKLRSMEERQQLTASAHYVVAHSSFGRVRLNAGLGRSIELVDYGVDTERFRPDCASPRSPEVADLFATRDRARVLFLGPPTHAGGAGRLIDLLVAVTARLPEAEFVVAGRDHENPDWEQVVRIEAMELGLANNLRILPSVPVADLPALYVACQVAMAPAIGNEAGGFFVLHALAAGMPVVASPGGAMEELIRDGQEGLLVPGSDTTEFANALCSLLVDPNARAAYGEAGRLSAVERHDFRRSVFALEELYHRLRDVGRRAVA